MISLVKSIINFFNNGNAKNEYAARLEEQLNKLEQKDLSSAKIIKKGEECPNQTIQKNCFRRVGVITSLDSNHGLIDKNLIFDISVAREFENINVGDRIEYLAYKAENSDYIKVVRIEAVVQEHWEDLPQDHIKNELESLKQQNAEYFNIHSRTVLGIIVEVKENIVTVDTDYGRIDVDKNQINKSYSFECGDNVTLDCNMQTDPTNFDSTGEILDVYQLRPSRRKEIHGSISQIGTSGGIIDGQYIFSFEALSSKYSPAMGDEVKADVVECDIGNFSWRCVSVKLINKSTSLIPSNKSSIANLYLKDKGIEVSDNIVFQFKNLHEYAEKEIIVQNKSDKPLKVLKCVFLSKLSQSQLRLLSPDKNLSFYINPNESQIFKLQAKSKFFGYSQEKFAIQFAGRIKIIREIEIEVDIENDLNKLSSKTQFTENKINSHYIQEVWNRKYNLIPGVGISIKPRFIHNRIGNYEVPEYLKKLVFNSGSKHELINELENHYLFLRSPLTAENYINRFQFLLHMEEIKYFENIRKYDRESAHFKREHDYLALEIENLAEQRPSLVIGDSVRAINTWSESVDNRCYEGIIHKVLFNRILLKFNQGFHANYQFEDYKLEFHFSRTSFKKQHYAITKILYHLGNEFLFPQPLETLKQSQISVELNDKGELISKITNEIYPWFNETLNKVQKRAICNILNGQGRPMPYILFGPPGTGKTMTLIEVALKINTLLPNSRILIATPSNSSADLIATRLINSSLTKPGDFVRLVSQWVIENDMIPDLLRPYCATVDIAAEGSDKTKMIVTESGLKLKCQLKHLGRHKIIIGTCITLGNLIHINFPKDHFTHLLIDESGQSVESEIMIPISLLDKLNCQIVLAGDPKQLGPIVLSKYAGDKGLDKSFLERILETKPYSRDTIKYPEYGYDPKLVTKLIYNYRSLPTILKVFNDLFYDSELISMIDEEKSNEIDIVNNIQEYFPTENFRSPKQAVFFVGVRGDNRQDEDSPSWYNASEAKSVFLFVLKLYKKRYEAKNIGIITPYRKQVRVIRNLFVQAEIYLPKVGSVEEFQGQERDIILISTVRSNRSIVQVDINHSLGFVQSEKRLNVAISRAKAVLIIFGNPHLLVMDPNWKYLLSYCVKNNAYMGCDLPSELSSVDAN